MKDLKIFMLDLGWRGSIVVIAKNSQEAVKKMSVCQNFLDRYGHLEISDLEKFVPECSEITDGFVFCNTGDM